MKKATNNSNLNKNENKVEEIMKDAEIKVEVKETEQQNPEQQKTEQKEKRIIRSFSQIILDRIDQKMKGLPTDVYTPIREKIQTALIELQVAVENNKENMKHSKSVNRKLSKFTVEEIQEYLEAMKLA